MVENEYTSKGLLTHVEYCLTCPTVYGWGGLMRILTVPYLLQLANMYPDKYPPTLVKKYKELSNKTYLCDCVGLIKSYWFGGVNSPNYNLKYDCNTNGMFAAAPTKGKIESMPEIPGLGVYIPGHVGVYMGDGKVIECTTMYGGGVVCTKLPERKWTHWFQIPYTKYTEKEKCQCNCACAKKGEIDI